MRRNKILCIGYSAIVVRRYGIAISSGAILGVAVLIDLRSTDFGATLSFSVEALKSPNYRLSGPLNRKRRYYLSDTPVQRDTPQRAA